MEATTDAAEEQFKLIAGNKRNETACNSLDNITVCSSAFNKTSDDLIDDGDTYLQRVLGFLIIGIIGIVANMSVILILGSLAKIRRKLVNTLIIHQSFVDLLASVALVGTAHLDGSDQHGLEGIHADIYCFFVTGKWPLWVMMNISSFSLMFLNIERYISIVYPMYHHTKVTRKKVLMLLPIVWVLGLLEQFLVSSSFTEENGACNFGSPDMVLYTMIQYIVLHFFLPVILVLFLYGHMMIRLRTSANSNNDATSTRRNDVMEKAKNNIFKTMLLITICYAICYVSNGVYVTLVLRGIITTISGQFYSFTVYMVCVNSIVNPFVYVIQYHEFQNRAKEMFCGKQDAAKDLTLSSVVTTETSAQ